MVPDITRHNSCAFSIESSRAISIEARIEQVLNDPFMPVFRERVKGMGSGPPLTGGRRQSALKHWFDLRDAALRSAHGWKKVSKETANRFLEPFAWTRAIITATDWDNFYALRARPEAGAQEELQTLARAMEAAQQASNPIDLDWGEWHLPLVRTADFQYAGVLGPYGLPKISAGRCASVSYARINTDEPVTHSWSRWVDKLAPKAHWSPGEHPARVPTESEWYEVCALQDEVLKSMALMGDSGKFLREQVARMTYWGKFNGWIPLRKHYEGERVHDTATAGRMI